MKHKQLAGILRSADEFVEKYEVVVRRIKRLCEEFDSGEFVDEGSMALQLRILFIDFQSGSRSLMNLMGVATNEKILSTLPRPITEKTISSTGFLGLKGDSSQIQWYAGLQESLGARNLLPTQRWLSEVVLKNPNFTFDREKIIRVIADKENGAHIDAAIDPEYYEIARNNGLGWVHINDKDEELKPGNPFPYALRQMCFEVLTTDKRFRDQGTLFRAKIQTKQD